MVSKINGNKNKLSLVFILTSLIMMLASYRTLNYNVMIISIVVLYLGMISRVEKDGILFFLFLSSFMVFLVSRSTLDIIDKYDWTIGWKGENLEKALPLLYVSLVMLYLGFHLSRKNKKSKENKSSEVSIFSNKLKSLSNSINSNALFILGVIILFLLTYIIAFYMEVDKYIFMRGRLYEEFYLYYSPKFSILVRMLASINKYLFFFLLSLRPKKITTYILFGLNIIKTIPLLLIGQRGEFTLAMVLMVVYYIMQQLSTGDKVWITKANIYTILGLIPILILLMAFINEGRHGSTFQFSGVLKTGKKFIHQQGVSFDTYMYGFENEAKIRMLTTNKNYVFGPIIEFIKYNPLTTIVFNIKPLPSGNNAIRAIEGNSFAHILAYVAHRGYLNGFGFGTTYISEAYHSYGLVGVMLLNILLGVIIFNIQEFFKGTVFKRFLAIIVICDILYLPRQSFSSILLFIIHPYFWATLILLSVLYYFVVKLQAKCDFSDEEKLVSLLFDLYN